MGPGRTATGRRRAGLAGRLAQNGQVNRLEGIDGLAVGEVVEVAGGHGNGAVAEQLGADHRYRRPGVLQLDSERVPQPVRVNPLVNACLRCQAPQENAHVVIGDRLAVQRAEQLAVLPPVTGGQLRRVSIQRASASSALG